MAVHYGKLTPNRPNYLGGGQWILADLTDITVIFGKNGSGKSVLLRQIFDDYRGEAQYISPERSGDITYQQSIVQEELNVDQRGNQRRGKNFAPRFRQESVSRLGSLKMKIGDVAGRGNTVPDILTKIEKAITTLLPDFERV